MHPQDLKNQAPKIKIPLSQMRRTLVARDPVIRAVFPQNHRKRPVELQDLKSLIHPKRNQIPKIPGIKIRFRLSRMKKTFVALNAVIKAAPPHQHWKRIMEPQDLKNPIHLKDNQTPKNPATKIRPLRSRMKKTLVALDPLLRAVLRQNHQTKIVEPQVRKNLILPRNNQTLHQKSQARKIRFPPTRKRTSVQDLQTRAVRKYLLIKSSRRKKEIPIPRLKYPIRHQWNQPTLNQKETIQSRLRRQKTLRIHRPQTKIQKVNQKMKRRKIC